MIANIVDVKALPGAQLWLAFSDGMAGVVSFDAVIGRGGVFSTLADPATFAAVRLGEHGRYVEFPGNLDFCADALHEQVALIQGSLAIT